MPDAPADSSMKIASLSNGVIEYIKADAYRYVSKYFDYHNNRSSYTVMSTFIEQQQQQQRGGIPRQIHRCCTLCCCSHCNVVVSTLCRLRSCGSCVPLSGLYQPAWGTGLPVKFALHRTCHFHIQQPLHIIITTLIVSEVNKALYIPACRF